MTLKCVKLACIELVSMKLREMFVHFHSRSLNIIVLDVYSQD